MSAGDHAAAISALSRRLQAASPKDVGALLVLVKEVQAMERLLQDDPGARQHFCSIMPGVLHVLRAGDPCFEPTNPSYVTRKALLELIHRMPTLEAMRGYVTDILELCIRQLETDNEEDCLLCLKLIIDIHKNYRPNSQEQVQRFLSVVQAMYQAFPLTVQCLLDPRQITQQAQQQIDQINEQLQQAQLQKREAETQMHQARTQYQQLHTSYQQLQTQANVLKQQAQQAPPNLPPGSPSPMAAFDQNVQQQHQVHAQLTQAQQRYSTAQTTQNQQTQFIAQLQAQTTQLQQQITAAQLQLQQQQQPKKKAEGDEPEAEAAARPCVKGMNSFKVLTECPIIVVLLFQLYKDLIRTNIPAFIPLIVKALTFTPVMPTKGPKYLRDVYGDFIAAQVKTLSFLAYSLNRNFTEAIQPHADKLSISVMHQLQDTPPEAASVRKELLIAARHILASDFRSVFVPQIDRLMDEQMLVGTGWTARESLRSIAYSTLADLVHNVREELNLQQIHRAVVVFLRNIMDNTLSLQIQMMSCKLLLNLVQVIASKNEPLSRQLLVAVLSTFVAKLGSLSHLQIPRVIAHFKQRASQETEPDAMDVTVDASESTDPAGTPGADGVPISDDDAPTDTRLNPIKARSLPDDHVDNVRDCRTLVKTLLNGLKTIIWGIALCGAPAGEANGVAGAVVNRPSPAPATFAPTEKHFFAELLRHGLHCLSIYGIAQDGAVRDLRGPNGAKPTQEEKETIDHFASVFIMIEQSLFRELFQSKMIFLVNCIFDNNLLLAIPQQILSNLPGSSFFAHELLRYLLSRLEDLGKPDANVAMVLLRLYRLVFGSVSLFSQSNEVVLQPFLSDIIHRAMALSATVEEPTNYFLLLRALFRSIGGGKFDLLYKEFLPLLPSLLNGLNRLQDGAHKQEMRDLFIELCLTVPVRLSALLPYLHYLMRPLVFALQAGEDLVSQGLRTLELCIDNLTPEFLDPILEPVRADLMNALWQHLQPPSSAPAAPSVPMDMSFTSALPSAPTAPSILPNVNVERGATTLRILGKLGGRNRCVLKTPPTLVPQHQSGPIARIQCNFGLNQVVHLPLADAIIQAQRMLQHEPSLENRREAFSFLQACTATVLQVESIPENISQLKIRPYPAAIPGMSGFAGAFRSPDMPPGSQLHVTTTLLSGLVFAAAEETLKAEAVSFLQDVVRHLTLLTVCSQRKDVQQKYRSSNKFLDPTIMAYTVASCLCVDSQPVLNTCMDMMNTMLQTSTGLLGSLEQAAQLSLFGRLLTEMCARCHSRQWYAKKGTCNGIKWLLDNMPQSWVTQWHIKIHKVLLFIIADLCNEVNGGVVRLAGDLLLDLIRRVLADGPFTFRTVQVTTTTTAQKQSGFEQLFKLLAPELLSPDDVLRGKIKEALELLSKLSGIDVSTLLQQTTLKDTLLPKTTRNCPINVQIGRMDALAYSLALSPPPVPFEPSVQQENGFTNNNNTNYFTEVVQICGLDDMAGRNALRPTAHVTPATLVTLRVQSITLATQVVRMSAWQTFRTHVVECFVRALLSQHEDIVTAACRGLVCMHEEHILDKEMLQTAIRPLLSNLSDCQKLTVPLLHSLCRLIEALPDCFNDQFINKLFEFLSTWLQRVQAEASQPDSARPDWKETDAVQVCVAILEIFCRLDTHVASLLVSMTDAVFIAETHMNRTLASPFRTPLARVLERHAPQAVAHFCARVADKGFDLFFRALLEESSSVRLREALAAQPELLVVHCFEPGVKALEAVDPALSAQLEVPGLQYTGLALVHTLCKHIPDFLNAAPAVTEHILSLWRLPVFRSRLQQDQVVVPETLVQPRIVLMCVLDYVRGRPNDLETIFELLSVCGLRSLVDLSFLHQFFYHDLPEKFPADVQNAVLLQTLTMFHDPVWPQTYKAHALEKLCIPILVNSVNQGTTVQVAGTGPEGFVQRWLDVMAKNPPAVYEDNLKMAILQLSAVVTDVCRATSAIMDEFSDELKHKYLKFAWNSTYLGDTNWTNEDASIRFAGVVLVCMIMSTFNYCPEQLLLELHRALLDSQATEPRVLIRQATDLLQPLLPRRVVTPAGKVPDWVRLVREAIMGDNQSQAHLLLIWTLIVHHSDVYYPYRYLLVPWLVQSLARAAQATTQPENRKFSLQVANMLLQWELRQRSEVDSSPQPAAEGAPQATALELVNAAIAPAAGSSSAIPSTVPTPLEAGEPAMTTTPASGAAPVTAQVPTTAAPATAPAVPAPPSIPLRYEIPSVLQEMMVNYLIQVACLTGESDGGGSTSNRCLQLLESLFQLEWWNTSSLNLTKMDALLAQCPTELVSSVHFGRYVVALRVLGLVCQYLKPDYTRIHMSRMRQGLLACSACQQPEVAKVFRDVMVRVLALYPLSGAANRIQELDGLYHGLQSRIESGLSSYERLSNPPLVAAALNSLAIFCQHQPAFVHTVMGHLLKVLQKLQREHVAQPSPPNMEENTELLIQGLDLTGMQLSTATDQTTKRPFLVVLQTLLDKTTSLPMLQYLTKLLGQWVRQEGHQTVPDKELAILLYKAVQAFVRRFPHDTEVSSLLEVILFVYSNSPSAAQLGQSELHSKLEAGFMLGLRSSSLQQREAFFRLFNLPAAEASLHGRIDYCFNDKYNKWDTSRQSFWMKHCLDLVLAGVSERAPVLSHKDDAMFIPLGMFADDSAGVSGTRADAQFIDAFVNNHERFLGRLSKTSTGDMFRSLRTLDFVSSQLAHGLWVKLFPLLWQLLTDEARLSVGQALQNLLQQDYHEDQAHLRPNNVHAIVTGIAHCTQPMLALPPTLLHHLSKTHNLWYTGINMLRCQQLRADARGEKVSDGRLDPIQDNLADLYEHLQEFDTWFGLWRLRSKLPKTARAMAFEQQGHWENAQAVYEDAIQTVHVEHEDMREAEFRLWEEHWKLCMDQLAHHDVLNKYAEEVKHQELALRSSWKLRSWKKVKEILNKMDHQRESHFYLKLFRAYHTMCTSDEITQPVVEKLCHDGLQIVLHDWGMLPSIVSQSHVPLLQACQQFTEAQESAQLIRVCHSPTAMQTHGQEITNQLETWRKRLPNLWDESVVWQDVLLWRITLLSKITLPGQGGSKPAPAITPVVAGGVAAGLAIAVPPPTVVLPMVDPAALAPLRDETVWSWIRLAQTARLHGLRPLCHRMLSSASKVPQPGKVPPIGAADIFLKSRELILCEMELKREETQEQLETIMAAPVEVFDEPQVAETFALRAKVLHDLGRWEDANRVFATALSFHSESGLGWELWGTYCEDMFKRVRESIRQRSSDTNERSSIKPEAATQSNAREWGKSAMTCYLNACRSYTDDEKPKRMIARALVLLTMDDSTGEIGMAFRHLADGVDTTCWKFWIPQLLTSLSRPEAPHVLNTFLRLAKTFPQALYYQLRTAYLEIKNSQAALAIRPPSTNPTAASAAERTSPAATPSRKRPGAPESADSPPKRLKTDGSGQGMDTSAEGAEEGDPAIDDVSKAPAAASALALQFVSQIMHQLRVKHSMLATAIENMIDEIVTRFKPTPEEELLRTTRVLLTECLKQSFARLDRSIMPNSTVSPDMLVPEQVALHLNRLLHSFFTEQNARVYPFRERFQRDFGELKDMTLDTCLLKLHEWHREVSNVVDQMPKYHRLEDLSRYLSSFATAHAEIDLPGEHLESRPGLASTLATRIERFLPQVQVVHKHSAAYRRIAIRGRNGQVYPYLVQQAPSRHARTEERLLHLFRMMNILLDKRKESRRRNINFHVPRMVPLNTHVRLVQDDATCISLEDVFQEHCAARKLDMDDPVMKCYKYRRQDPQRRMANEGQEIRKVIFDKIRTEDVPSDVLSTYMRGCFPDHMELWMFQRQFTGQLALSAFATHILMLNKGAPHTIKFILSTGQIVPWELAPSFNIQGAMVAPDPVPFRLTPNLVNFLTPVGITGIFSSTILAAAQTLNEPEFTVHDYFGAVLRDELISWHANHISPFSKSALDNENLVIKVERNIAAVQKRLRSLATFDGSNSSVDVLIKHATASNNLCLMSPTWHPWL